MNKKYGIAGLILIVVLATVMISGCIGSNDNTNDKFTKTATFQGTTFYLPDGFESVEKSTTGTSVYELYSDGKDAIGLFYYPLLSSKSEGLSNMKSNPNYANIDESVSYGGYSGYSANFTDSDGEVAKIFIFEKDGKVLAITMSNGLNFNEYLPKIIG